MYLAPIISNAHVSEANTGEPFLSPGVAGGEPYIEALANTGLTFEVMADDAKIDFSRLIAASKE